MKVDEKANSFKFSLDESKPQPPESDEEYGLKLHIAELESLIKDMWNGMCSYGHNCMVCEHYVSAKDCCSFYIKMRQLNVLKEDEWIRQL